MRVSYPHSTLAYIWPHNAFCYDFKGGKFLKNCGASLVGEINKVIWYYKLI